MGSNAVPFMYQGQWVARCPTPGCFNVEKRGRCDNHTLGGLEADRFHCRIEYGGCGIFCGVDWPRNITELETLLMARPVVNRNWIPGEDIRTIMLENAEHGIEPTEPHLYAVVGSVTGTDPLALAAGARLREIGG